MSKRTSKAEVGKIRGASRAHGEANRYGGDELKAAVLAECRRKFANGIGRAVAEAKGQSLPEEWDDWWRCRLLGLRTPDEDTRRRTFIGPGKWLVLDARALLVRHLEHYGFPGLPQTFTTEGSGEFISRHDMAVLSLLCGSWPSISNNERKLGIKLSVAQVIAREEKLIEKHSVRYGPHAAVEPDPAQDLPPDTLLFSNYEKRILNPEIRWVTRKVPRRRRG